MRQNRFLGGELELNPESEVNGVVEQNPSVKKTEFKVTDMRFFKLKRFYMFFAIASIVVSSISVSCKKEDDSDKKEDIIEEPKEVIPVVKGTTWQSGGTVLYFTTDTITWTTYYAGTSSTIFGTYEFVNPKIEIELTGLNGQVVEFDGTVVKDTMNLNFQGGLVFYKQR